MFHTNAWLIGSTAETTILFVYSSFGNLSLNLKLYIQ